MDILEDIILSSIPDINQLEVIYQILYLKIFDKRR